MQKFIAMFVLTCWEFFLLENTPSGILCKVTTVTQLYYCRNLCLKWMSRCVFLSCRSCLHCLLFIWFLFLYLIFLINCAYLFKKEKNNQTKTKPQENSPWIRNILKINSLLAAAGCMSVMQEFAKSLLLSRWDFWLDFTSRSYAQSLCRRKCM